MSPKKRTLFSWSSGKDSAWALHTLQQNPDIDIVGLFTTINEAFDRVAMHAVRSELLENQARSLGLPLNKISLPYPCLNDQYEAIMTDFVSSAKTDGIECFAFGDLYLEDVRRYREDKLADTGITPIFPLWGKPTKELAEEMISNGLRAVVTCIDPKHLSLELSGSEFNHAFLSRLPSNIDPCGENGEFHSFAYDGPMFNEKINIAVGETVVRDGFIFSDLLPA